MKIYNSRKVIRRDLDKFIGEPIWVRVEASDHSIWWVRLLDVKKSAKTLRDYYTCFAIPEGYLDWGPARQSATDNVVTFWYDEIGLTYPMNVRTYDELIDEESL